MIVFYNKDMRRLVLMILFGVLMTTIDSASRMEIPETLKRVITSFSDSFELERHFPFDPECKPLKEWTSTPSVSNYIALHIRLEFGYLPVDTLICGFMD